jgi:predicted ArsR family transcriptional regulator
VLRAVHRTNRRWFYNGRVNLGQDIETIALLHEPTRRRLYEYVRRSHGPVGRDEAAAAAGVSRGLAAFHLDRLARGGLLDAEYRRVAGRSGPGAGRPAKLYRPSARRVGVNLPETRYELMGSVLLRSLRDEGWSGPARESALRTASARGRELGGELTAEAASGPDLKRVERALNALGFEPERSRSMVRLRNCPFHALVEESKEMVCGLNLAMVAGLAEALECRDLVAEFDPDPGGCCVRLRDLAKM